VAGRLCASRVPWNRFLCCRKVLAIITVNVWSFCAGTLARTTYSLEQFPCCHKVLYRNYNFTLI
jgi:hypothetical protein